MKRFILIVTAVFILCVQNAFAISVSAQSAILLEASSGKILYQKDAKTRRGMASTTKIMTALVVLERVGLDEIVTVPASCVGVEGSSMYLQAGEELSVLDLLYGLLLQSGNDCAAVLAEYVAGEQERFVALMNQKGAALQLHDTHFMNPSGLPDEGHYSTAYDMARLAAYAMARDDFRKIVSTRTYKTGTHFLANHNRLLSMCEGVDGVKTGFTKAAGRCLVSSCMRNGTRLICVTLSAPNDWNDHQSLYEYGFSSCMRVLVKEKGEAVANLPVVGGVQSSVSVILSDDLAAVVHPSEAQQLSVTYYLPHFLYAPVSKNAVVGTAVLSKNGEILASVPLHILSAVNAAQSNGLRSFFTRIFS